jgi:hypothetical protein
MKTKFLFIIFIPCLSFTIVRSHAQQALPARSFSDCIGVWKILPTSSGIKQNTPATTYLLLNADSSYVWGIDSTLANPLAKVSRGKWALTSDGDIKLSYGSESTTHYITYFSPIGSWKYSLQAMDENGTKTPSIMMETEFIIERIGDLKTK